MHHSPKRPAFTLVELLTVVLIISVLVGLLIPVVGKVRRSAQAAAVQNQISIIGQACDNYFHDFHAYPGPVSNLNIGPNAAPIMQDQITVVSGGIAPGISVVGTSTANLTMSENLVLGVIGGLVRNPAYNGTNAVSAAFYDPQQLFPGINQTPISYATGTAPGPVSLNVNLSKRYGSYMPAQDLSDGYYHDAIVNSLSAGATTGKDKAIDDTIVPEFLDKFPSRMPILYLRARTGATTSGTKSADNPIITDGTNRSTMGQYDISQIIAYTKSYGSGPSLLTVGEGKSAPTFYSNGAQVSSNPPYHGLATVTYGVTMTSPGSPTYTYPYDAFAYFSHPTLANTPRQKDGYILISAGIDRIYGTNDDICSFGSLQQ